MPQHARCFTYLLYLLYLLYLSYLLPVLAPSSREPHHRPAYLLYLRYLLPVLALLVVSRIIDLLHTAVTCVAIQFVLALLALLTAFTCFTSREPHHRPAPHRRDVRGPK